MLYKTSGKQLSIGVQTPIVIQTPGGHARWEEDASIEDLREIVIAADRLGYHHLTCSEHVAVQAEAAEIRGAVYWDPVATLAWIADSISQIQLASNVVVLGYHHPTELLKAYGTIDRLSGGRVILGVGVGTLREEFDLLDAEFAGRGDRADEALRAIRTGWGRHSVEHSGDHYRYGPVIVEPHAPRETVRIWVGGSTRRSLRRAAELGDGWTPFGIPTRALSSMLAECDLPQGFDVVIGSPRPLDPIGDTESTRTALDDLATAGVTGLHAAFVHRSRQHYLEQLAALADLVASN